MTGGERKEEKIRCACCGRSTGEVDPAGSSDWLRQDVVLGLGVCSHCPEWLEAWDSGHREVDLRIRAEKLGEAGGSNLELDQLVRTARLPSYSSVLLEIYDLLSDDSAGADRIADLLEADAALTARTLRLANSAFYGAAREIATVKEALVLIGPVDLWWLLFTAEVKGLFYGIDRHLMDMESFWRHSLMVAAASQVLAQRHRIGQMREMFVAGLLHDLGKLLLLQQRPIEYGAVLERVEQGESLLAVEREVFGFTHAVVGGRLLQCWQLPARLVELVRSHHVLDSPAAETSPVALGNRLVHRMETSPELVEDDDRAVAEAIMRRYQQLVRLVRP